MHRRRVSVVMRCSFAGDRTAAVSAASSFVSAATAIQRQPGCRRRPRQAPPRRSMTACSVIDGRTTVRITLSPRDACASNQTQNSGSRSRNSAFTSAAGRARGRHCCQPPRNRRARPSRSARLREPPPGSRGCRPGGCRSLFTDATGHGGVRRRVTAAMRACSACRSLPVGSRSGGGWSQLREPMTALQPDVCRRRIMLGTVHRSSLSSNLVLESQRLLNTATAPDSRDTAVSTVGQVTMASTV